MLFARSRPWTRLLLEIAGYYVVYIGVNTLITVQSLEEFVMSIFNPGHVDTANALGLIASFVLAPIIIARLLLLFLWFISPEPALNRTGAIHPPYRMFRLLPVTYWERTKVVIKANTWLLFSMLPVGAIFAHTPAYQLVLRSIPHSFAIMRSE